MTWRYLELRAGVVDLSDGVMLRDGEAVDLSPLEVCLLRALAVADQPLTREDLLRGVWSLSPKTNTRAVEACMHRLRAKLEVDPSAPDHLRTLRGVGYRLEGLASNETMLPQPAHIALPRDAFVGRESELQELALSLEQTRLVTVTGPPGVGKSRLAHELVRQLRETKTFWLVDTDLAPTRGEWLRAVGAHVGLSGVVLPDAIGLQLVGTKSTILWLDNLDRLVGSVATLLDRWLDLSPSIRILVTAREPLRLRGERVYDLEPLPLAQAERLLELRSGSKQGANIVEALDRLPLGIELASSWLQTLSATEIEAALQGTAQPMLTSDRRDVPARHRSMDAAFEVSWALLDPDDREVLGAAAVFARAFAAAEVAQIAQISEEVALSAMRRLSQRSLIGRGAERFSLLRTMRRFVLEQLSTSRRQLLVQAHAAHFADRGDCARKAMDRWGRPEAFAELTELLPELELASTRALGAEGARCLALVHANAVTSGDLRGSSELIDKAIDLCPPSNRALYLRLLIVRAQRFVTLGSDDADEAVGDVLRRASSLGPSEALINAHRVCAEFHRGQGDQLEGQRQVSLAVECANKLGDPMWMTLTRGEAVLTVASASPELLDETADLILDAERSGFLGLADMLVIVLAARYDALERPVGPELIDQLRVALDRCEARGEHRATTGALLALGVSLVRMQQAVEAEDHLERAVALACEICRPRMEARARLYLAAMDARHADRHRRIGLYLAEQLNDDRLIEISRRGLGR